MCKGKKTATAAAEELVDPKVPEFMDAANDGELDKVEEIYPAFGDKKGLLSYKNGEGSTALHLAANNGHSEIVEYLVRCLLADCSDMAHDLLNKPNNIGFTPLFCACFRGYPSKGLKDYAQDDRLAITKCLIKNGANCSPITKDTNMTPAHWAAYNKDQDVCKELLSHGAD